MFPAAFFVQSSRNACYCETYDAWSICASDVMMRSMRTTLDIDATVLAAAKEIARVRGQSAGAVISELARKGLQNERSKVKRKGGFPVFDVPEDAQTLTTEVVEGIIEDEGIPARR
jgi:hypothetical protein